MITASEARSKILEVARPLPAQHVKLEDSLGLVLAEDVVSSMDLPPFDNSSMDGFAILSKTLKVKGQKISQVIKAGDAPKELEPGTCAKIMTGAPLPKGADTVVPIEDVAVERGVVIFNRPVKKGQYVRYAGEDIKKGEVLAKAGSLITSRLIALFAAVGLMEAPVYRRPHVTIITTGAELQQPGTALKIGEIYDSNRAALSAALEELGINAKTSSVQDEKQQIIAVLKDAFRSCDIVLTVGGVSVGEYDYVKEALKKIGVTEIFHKVNIRPGKPLFFGMAPQGALVFGLPGNPVSCMITFDRFVRPAILKMMGYKKLEKDRQVAVAAEVLRHPLDSRGKTVFLGGIYERLNGRLTVRLSGSQGSAMLKSFANANCTIIIPEDKERIELGEEVEVELWNSSF